MAADAQGQGDQLHQLVGEGRLDLPLPGLPQVGVRAGVAGEDGHFHARKAGGQVVAEGVQEGLFRLEHPSDFFIGVQFAALDLQHGLDVQHGGHGRSGCRHAAAFFEVFQGVHCNVDAGGIFFRL